MSLTAPSEAQPDVAATVVQVARPGLRRFLKDSIIVGIGSTFARVLGLLFNILIARLLTPDDFGFARYSLTLAGVLTIVSASAPGAIGRFLAAHPDDREARDRYYTNGVVGFGAILLASLAISVPAMFILGKFDVGTLFAVVGLSVFFMYISVMRGLSSSWKIGLGYISTNVVLLFVTVVVLGLFGWQSATLALIIFGVANCAPLVILEVARKTPLSFRRSLVSRETLIELGKFSVPMILSNAAYTLWYGMDMLLIEGLSPQNTADYSAAKTLSQAFIFVPTAISMVLMPRVAAMELRRSVKLASFAALLAYGLSLIGVLIVWLAGEPLVRLVFGDGYARAYLPLFIMGLGMTVYSVYLVFEGFMLGRGQPGSHAWAMFVAMLVSFGVGFVLTPGYGLLGASLAFTLGITCATFVLTFNMWRFLRSH
jgi:O-antigen/teichoic acid export membrane protein